MELLEKKIHNILKKILNEEFGVNDEVYKVANEIMALIRKDATQKKNDEKYKETLDGFIHCVGGEFPFEMVGKTITVTYNSYIFDTNETYRKYICQYPHKLMNATSRYNQGDCQMYVVYNYTEESGYDESVLDRIQHELEHLYQEIMKQGQFPSSELKERVNKGLKLMRKEHNIFMASFILYCSRQYEQDACANGLYNWLMNGNSDKEEIIKNSALVRNRRICIKYIAKLEDVCKDTKESHKIKSFLGLAPEKIIKKGYNTIETMKIKANRVIFKYIKETNNKIGFVK